MVEQRQPLETAIRKATRRLIWFLALLYFFAIMDRVNVGVAGTAMRAHLGLGAGAFGFGAGIFFVSYALLEIPSNLMLARFGARRWLARIVVTWGIAAMAVALARGVTSFAALRLLLGVAEAGFFPGVLFYLTLWFPKQHRARINAMFLLGLPLSNALAAAISSPILALDGTLGLAGWQWLFVLEGAPPVILGLLALRVLADSPRTVAWLEPAEKAALLATLAAETPGGKQSENLRAVLLMPAMWWLSLAYFGLNMSLASLGMWLPQVVHAVGNYSAIASGLVAAAILLPAALAMFLWSRRSDARGERVGHLAVAAIAACAGWGCSSLASGPASSIACLTLAAAGTYATLSVFWTLPTALLSGRAAAAGIAMIGSLGNFGGLAGPWAIGQLHDATGGFAGGFGVVAVALLVTSAIAWQTGRRIFAPAAPA